MSKANLGDKVKCKVTGVTGIVITASRHLYGCDRVGVQPLAGADNKVPESHWTDLESVEVLEAGVVKGHVDLPAEKKTGGPALRGQTPRQENPK